MTPLRGKVEVTVALSDEEEVDALYEFDFSPGSPGRLSGPPEDCYPDEPAEVEPISLRTFEDPPRELDVDSLSDRMQDYLYEQAMDWYNLYQEAAKAEWADYAREDHDC